MSKKQKTILVLVAVVVFAVSFIPLFGVMWKNNKHTEGYDSLMETAEKFDEMYRGSDSKGALNLADDFDVEKGEYKALFENNDYYIVLYYDKDRNFQGGELVDKTKSVVGLVLISAILSLLISIVVEIVAYGFVSSYNFKKNSNRKK